LAQYTGQEAALRSQGVRIYGPGASASQDFEPEYIAVSADGKTAWVTLQENNALAKVDIATATVKAILPLGYKDHGACWQRTGCFLDSDKIIKIQNWAGVRGMYLPDSMASYSVGGKTYLVTANEGDARAWGEDNDAYWAGDASKGFVEEFRVKHLVHKSGSTAARATICRLSCVLWLPAVCSTRAIFAYCGAVAGDPAGCRADDALGRLEHFLDHGLSR
jgi:hypothetical protein